MQHRDEFADRIDREPQPQHVRPTAQPRAQFVELDVRQVEVAKDAVVQRRAVCPGPREPGGNGRMTMAEEVHRGGHREPFRQRSQYLRNTLRCSFQAVQRCHPEGRRAAQ
jgi:hypothetical protein